MSLLLYCSRGPGTCKSHNVCEIHDVAITLLQSRARYLQVAKQMKAYEDTLYDQWRENVEQILPSLLRRNLLTKPLKDQVAEGLPTAPPTDEDDCESK